MERGNANMTIVKQISPMLCVSDLERFVAFYRDVLLFDVLMNSSRYAIIERDGATIHLHPADEEVLSRLRGQIEIYIEVDDLDALWEHVSRFRGGKWRIREPFTQAYGMREFHIDDPDGCTVFIGQVA